MTMMIRGATTDDYTDIAAIISTIDPNFMTTAEDLVNGDKRNPAHCKTGIVVADVGGRVVGYARYSQRSGMYHPQKFWANLMVLPEHQGKGMGTALWTGLMAALTPLNPISIIANVREDRAVGRQFLEKRGFIEIMRTWENVLLLDTFDPTTVASAVAAVEQHGYRLASLSILADDPDMRQKLYTCFAEARLDVPRPEPSTTISFEDFEREHFANKDFNPDFLWVAIGESGEYVATSALWKSNTPTMMYIGLTGTCRAHRRQGLALALKLKAMELAKARGVEKIITWNDSRNLPMLALNEQLGFVRQPAWIDYRLMIQPG
jgi:mycothiol synthase